MMQRDQEELTAPATGEEWLITRKLLIAFWKYATAGVVIEGATMKTA